MERSHEGGFGSNHKVESCGELQHSIRTNRPSLGKSYTERYGDYSKVVT